MPSTNRWYPWLLEQDAIWIDKVGRILNVPEIEGRYALNILKFIWRTHRKDVDTESPGPLFAALKATARREMGLYEAEIDSMIRAEPDRPVLRDGWMNDYWDDDWRWGED